MEPIRNFQNAARVFPFPQEAVLAPQGHTWGGGTPETDGQQLGGGEDVMLSSGLQGHHFTVSQTPGPDLLPGIFCPSATTPHQEQFAWGQGAPKDCSAPGGPGTVFSCFPGALDHSWLKICSQNQVLTSETATHTEVVHTH